MNQVIHDWYDSHTDELERLALNIWGHPETSMEEFYACERLCDTLKRHGFEVMSYHCQDASLPPNTILATWGSGHPVIGIMGEYDSLTGLGQDAVAQESRRPGFGHGCGHNLIGAAGASAAIAVKAVMQAEGLSGTVKFLGCPGEEGGSGKLHMFRDGLFDDVDCCLFWHPKACDVIPYESILQAISILKVEFRGKAAHAAAEPQLGRSALDAAELMSVGVQYLREHVTPDCRMHHCYKAAGDRPNIVPDYAAQEWYVRSADLKTNKALLDRVKKVGEGAALMTETSVEFTVDSMCSETFIVDGFNQFFYRALEKIPPLTYTEEEQQFARTLYQNVCNRQPEGEVLFTGIEKPTGTPNYLAGSTDAGYVTYRIPTSRLFGLGIVRDIPMHHWGVTATAGMSIGLKAAAFASKAIAQCAYDILKSPNAVEEWKKELQAQRGSDPVEPIWPPHR